MRRATKVLALFLTDLILRRQHMRPKGTSQALERRRRLAVELLEKGAAPGALAVRLGVSRPTLYRWRRLTLMPNGLAAKPRPRPEPRLSDEQLAQLEALLAQGARLHGWASDTWTGERVARLIDRHFRVKLCPDHVLRVLRQRRGWTMRMLRATLPQRRFLTFPAVNGTLPQKLSTGT